MKIRILFLGDISGSNGRRAVRTLVPALRSHLNINFVVANGENAAGGLGITKSTAMDIYDGGVDVITLGNHSFAKREALEFISREPRLLRPANLPPGAPGHGWAVFETAEGERIAVVNMMGRVYMDPIDCPFRVADTVLSQIQGQADVILVDMHAEATSEKVALGYYLDGRASAVVGTHTHVQTSDERVLPKGTAYITDAGMTGVHDSVLGLDVDSVIEKFKSKLPGKFQLAEGSAMLQGVLIDVDSRSGRALDIKRVNIMETEDIGPDFHI